MKIEKLREECEKRGMKIKIKEYQLGIVVYILWKQEDEKKLIELASKFDIYNIEGFNKPVSISV